MVEITDIELSTDENLAKCVIENANKTIISYHNFDETPSLDKLEQIVQKSYELGDIAKIALKPQKIEDTYKVIEILIKYPGTIAISMDDMGSYTRIMGPIMKSPVTYASIEKSSAPGQLDIQTTAKILEKLQAEGKK